MQQPEADQRHYKNAASALTWGLQCAVYIAQAGAPTRTGCAAFITVKVNSIGKAQHGDIAGQAQGSMRRLSQRQQLRLSCLRVWSKVGVQHGDVVTQPGWRKVVRAQWHQR